MFPKTIYHETEGPRVVKNQRELDAHLKEGWQEQPTPQRDYPRMVYHRTKGHTIVADAAGHKAHLNDGWRDEPFLPKAQNSEVSLEDRVSLLEERLEEVEKLLNVQMGVIPAAAQQQAPQAKGKE